LSREIGKASGKWLTDGHGEHGFYGKGGWVENTECKNQKAQGKSKKGGKGRIFI
jgi:hypothetical protein